MSDYAHRADDQHARKVARGLELMAMVPELAIVPAPRHVRVRRAWWRLGR